MNELIKIHDNKGLKVISAKGKPYDNVPIVSLQSGSIGVLYSELKIRDVSVNPFCSLNDCNEFVCNDNGEVIDLKIDIRILDASIEPFNEIPKEIIIQKTYIMLDAKSKLYKIGKSKNPLFREKTLASEIPEITLIATTEKDIEKYLHDKFKHLRVRGEWFKIPYKDIANIIVEFDFNEYNPKNN